MGELNDGAPRDDGLDVRWSSDYLYITSLYPDVKPYLWGLLSSTWNQGAREYAAGKGDPFLPDDPGDLPRTRAGAMRLLLRRLRGAVSHMTRVWGWGG